MTGCCDDELRLKNEAMLATALGEWVQTMRNFVIAVALIIIGIGIAGCWGIPKIPKF
jgi:hypothetical protein